MRRTGLLIRTRPQARQPCPPQDAASPHLDLRDVPARVLELVNLYYSSSRSFTHAFQAVHLCPSFPSFVLLVVQLPTVLLGFSQATVTVFQLRPFSQPGITTFKAVHAAWIRTRSPATTLFLREPTYAILLRRILLSESDLEDPAALFTKSIFYPEGMRSTFELVCDHIDWREASSTLIDSLQKTIYNIFVECGEGSSRPKR